MKKKISIIISLILLAAVIACSAPGLTPGTMEPTVPQESPTPLAATAVLQTTITETPEAWNASLGLTLEALQNATYRLDGCALGTQDYTLVDGEFTSSTNTAAPDYVSISLAEPVALGDLNYDGVQDAAVLLAVNCGGSGVFVYLAAVLSNDGKPWHVATTYLDDRPIINTMEIVDGEIRADTVIHASSDPMCCPTAEYQQGYRLYGNELALTYWAGETPDGSPRTITITSPADLETVRYLFTVNGSVNIGPFENTLAYAVYTENNSEITSGSVMTDSPDMGAPGNFSLPLDLSMAGVTGWVRVEFAEYSMRDGSLMTLDSVLVNVVGE